MSGPTFLEILGKRLAEQGAGDRRGVDGGSGHRIVASGPRRLASPASGRRDPAAPCNCDGKRKVPGVRKVG